MRIEILNDANGRLDSITSYHVATGGSVINQIKREYAPWRQLTKEYQEHAGTVNTGTSKKVQYAYGDGTNNNVRRMSLTYPNTLGLSYPYGPANDMLQGKSVPTIANRF
jgi:hypothetical protein